MVVVWGRGVCLELVYSFVRSIFVIVKDETYLYARLQRGVRGMGLPDSRRELALCARTDRIMT